MHYSKLINKYKGNIKKTWSVIKEAIGKGKNYQQSLPKKIFVEEKKITDIKSTAENFNRYFTEIGPTLAKKGWFFFRKFSSIFRSIYITITQPEKDLTVNELKEAFFSLKLNKSPGYGEVSFNVIKKCFESLHKPLLHIFNVPVQNGTFPDELKIARATPLFKNGSDSDLVNYRPISVLTCFSKILEKIMYNRPYKHLTDNVLYKKQLGFQEKHSTEHAILHLVE